MRFPPLPSASRSAFSGLGMPSILKRNGSENCSSFTLVIFSQMVSGLPVISMAELMVLIICFFPVASVVVQFIAYYKGKVYRSLRRYICI